MHPVRALIAFLVASTFVVVACGGDSSGTAGNSQTDIPPSSCPAEPCKVGTTCLGPAEPACDGTWYCWSDAKWHCAPPDGGGGGGYPPDATMDSVAPESSTSDVAAGG